MTSVETPSSDTINEENTTQQHEEEDLYTTEENSYQSSSASSTTTTTTSSTGENEEDTPTTLELPPVDLSTPHRLQHKWSLWYDNPGKRTSTAAWGDHLKFIVSFDTVEDFWRVFNNIKPASELPPGSNYHLFKDPIEPKWEDEANVGGGKWVVPVPKLPRVNLTDQYWLWAVLACIGEGLENADEVSGLVVSIRRQQDRLALWTRDARSETIVKNVGRSLKRVLEIPEATTVGYAVHSDALKNSKNPKDRYYL